MKKTMNVSQHVELSHINTSGKKKQSHIKNRWTNHDIAQHVEQSHIKNRWKNHERSAAC